MRRTYLDYNATSPTKPEVIDAVSDCLKSWSNPSSVHQAGRDSKACLEAARRQVAALAGCHSKQIVFTSGGTEADNMVIQDASFDSYLALATEHPAVRVPIQMKGSKAQSLKVDDQGIIDLAFLEAALKQATGKILLCVMYANNETGAVQPIKEVVALARQYDAWVHCDAVQALGKIPVSFSDLGVHSMALSAHKIGGPPGVGALIVAEGQEVAPWIQGGGQERSFRSGTVNVPGVVGFGIAAELAQACLADASNHAVLRDQFEEALKRITPDVRIFSEDAKRLPNTSMFALEGFDSSVLFVSLDLAGICVSTGSACSSGVAKLSPVLLAMGVPEALAKSAIRISTGWASRQEDIDAFLKVWFRITASSGQNNKQPIA